MQVDRVDIVPEHAFAHAHVQHTADSVDRGNVELLNRARFRQVLSLVNVLDRDKAHVISVRYMVIESESNEFPQRIDRAQAVEPKASFDLP